jgi:hypothetical protein
LAEGPIGSLMRVPIAAAILILFGARVAPSLETRLIDYDIDGTAKYADVTWNSGPGSTEQKQIKFPFHESFRMPVGEVAYISAQKVKVTRPDPLQKGAIEILSDGVHGTVHVEIHVNWRPSGEATADAPFGIAKVSARIE